jgi:hypothetical protein
MRFILYVSLLFVSACVAHQQTPQKVCESSESLFAGQSFTADEKNIEETAEISARVKWCGFEYEPFYLASMQYERLDSCKTQTQLAYLGYTHGDLYKGQLDSLAHRKCEASDRQKLKLDYQRKLDQICERADESQQLKKDCRSARKIEI